VKVLARLEEAETEEIAEIVRRKIAGDLTAKARDS
jgi:hypothetical protein